MQTNGVKIIGRVLYGRIGASMSYAGSRKAFGFAPPHIVVNGRGTAWATGCD